MKFIYTLNSFLSPYRRVLFSVTSFFSKLIIFFLGLLIGIIISYLNIVDLSNFRGIIEWAKSFLL